MSSAEIAPILAIFQAVMVEQFDQLIFEMAATVRRQVAILQKI